MCRLQPIPSALASLVLRHNQPVLIQHIYMSAAQTELKL